MQKLGRVWLLAASLVAISFGLTPHVVSQTANVTSLLDSLSTQYDWIEYRLAQERWRVLTGEPADSMAFFEDLAAHLVAHPATLKRLHSATAAGLSDEYRRKHQFFLHRGAVAAVALSRAVRPVRDSLMDAYARAALTGDSSRLAEASSRSSSASAREEAYRTLWGGSEARAAQVEALIRLRNQEANREGYNNYAALWHGHSALSLDDYARLLTELEAETQAAYDGLLARLRSSNATGAVQVWDLEALAGAAQLQNPGVFTDDTLFVTMLSTLGAAGFAFDDLPIYYQWLDTADGSPVTAVPVRPPIDQRLVGTLAPGHATQARLLGQTGVAVYSAYVRESDPLFNRPLDGPMRFAIARLFETMAAQESWFVDVVALAPSTARQAAGTTRDLALIRLRTLLTLAAFELEAYRNPNRDLNKLYWDTFDRIMSLPRHEDLHPWAARRGLVSDPFDAGQRLMGWLIAAQTWEYLDDFSGAVVSSRDTRAFLVQNYFRFGARYTWPELLERGTGTGVSVEHIQRFLSE